MKAARLVAGAARKAFIAWRAGRLQLSPAQWRTHLRNYYAEMTGRFPMRVHPAAVAPFRNLRLGSPAGAPPRFLVIAGAVPTPDTDSGSLRLFEILKLLTEIGYAVTFLSDSEERRPRYANQLRRLKIRIEYGPEDIVDHLFADGHTYHYVLLSQPHMAFRYLFAVRATAIHATVVYDTVDVHWVRLNREASLTNNRTRLLEAEQYRRMERFNAAGSDLVLATTDADKAALLGDDPRLRIEIIPNIHPPAARSGQRGWEKRRDLMFIGSFSHPPNQDGVVHFVEQILPLIHRELPGVVFNIIGSHMPPTVKALASTSVRPIGYVADPETYFHDCRVFVSPLRFGAGMKGKIGHSMSFGVPVVTTTIGAEGLMLLDGENALIADTPEAFASAVVRLYTDEALWSRIAAASVAHIHRHFSETAARRRIATLFPIDADGPAVVDSARA